LTAFLSWKIFSFKTSNIDRKSVLVVKNLRLTALWHVGHFILSHPVRCLYNNCSRH